MFMIQGIKLKPNRYSDNTTCGLKAAYPEKLRKPQQEVTGYPVIPLAGLTFSSFQVRAIHGF
jgi:hypothetical protein